MCANRGGWNRSVGHPVQIDMLEQLLRDHDGVITRVIAEIEFALSRRADAAANSRTDAAR